MIRHLSVVALALIAATTVVHAHDVSRSQSRLEVRGADVQGSLTLDLLEFNGVDVNGDAVISHDELERAIERIYAAVSAHFVVGDPNPPQRTRVARYEIVEDHLLRLELVYTFPRPPARVAVTSTLHEITRPEHRHLTGVGVDGAVQQAVLGADAATIVFDRGAAHSSADTVRRFVTLGIEHIVTGYDHLAFLVCLLIATTTFRSLVRVVTSFTIAHSITLALAAFDLVVLPTRLTESVIALSIAYVAIENLFQFRAVERDRITFLFGLVHGFGFSNVLREMALPRASLALSLFSFNVGVEIGQIVFVAVVFPVVLLLGSRPWPQLRPAVSLSVACLAVYWFVQRAFFG